MDKTLDFILDVAKLLRLYNGRRATAFRIPPSAR